jgi:sulfur relay (sulfurtransferase) complex TusBCD TusD component (DsrE family)
VDAFRFGTAARKTGHEVKLFLMGEVVECEGQHHEKYDVAEQLANYVAEVEELLACGTCLKSRQLEGQKHQLWNARVTKRDIVTDGFGVSAGSQDACVLFKILHGEEPVVLLQKAHESLRPGG